MKLPARCCRKANYSEFTTTDREMQPCRLRQLPASPGPADAELHRRSLITEPNTRIHFRMRLREMLLLTDGISHSHVSLHDGQI